MKSILLFITMMFFGCAENSMSIPPEQILYEKSSIVCYVLGTDLMLVTLQNDIYDGDFSANGITGAGNNIIINVDWIVEMDTCIHPQ